MDSAAGLQSTVLAQLSESGVEFRETSSAKPRNININVFNLRVGVLEYVSCSVRYKRTGETIDISGAQELT